jgi:hypothetical protein
MVAEKFRPMASKPLPDPYESAWCRATCKRNSRMYRPIHRIAYSLRLEIPQPAPQQMLEPFPLPQGDANDFGPRLTGLVGCLQMHTSLDGDFLKQDRPWRNSDVCQTYRTMNIPSRSENTAVVRASQSPDAPYPSNMKHELFCPDQ